MEKRNLEEVRAEFMAFLCMTDDEKIRNYGANTQRAFAEYHKVRDKQLSEWKASAKFKKAYQEAFVDTFRKHLPAARDTLLLRGIEDGDVNALKEVFKIAGLSIERVEQLNDGDIQEVIGVIVKAVNDIFGDQADKMKEFSERLKDDLGEL